MSIHGIPGRAKGLREASSKKLLRRTMEFAGTLRRLGDIVLNVSFQALYNLRNASRRKGLTANATRAASKADSSRAASSTFRSASAHR